MLICVEPQYLVRIPKTSFTQQDSYLSPITTKPGFCICEKQTHISCAVTSALYFSYTDSTISPLSKSKFNPLAIFCSCKVRFVSDLVGNPKHRFCHDAARFGTPLILEWNKIRTNPCFITALIALIILSYSL